jgi:hypothetical protein
MTNQSKTNRKSLKTIIATGALALTSWLNSSAQEEKSVLLPRPTLSAYENPYSTPQPTLFAQERVFDPHEIRCAEFREREEQWMRNTINHAENRPLVNYCPQLSQDYSIKDLQKALGNLWCLVPPQTRYEWPINRWSKTKPENRRGISNIYRNTFRYFTTLPPNQQAEFVDFNQAYLYAITHFSKPELLMFNTTNGSATRHYSSNYPWLSLQLPNVADRMIIYCQEYRDNPTINRINQENVRRLKQQAFYEHDAEITRKIAEESARSFKN